MHKQAGGADRQSWGRGKCSFQRLTLPSTYDICTPPRLQYICPDELLSSVDALITDGPRSQTAHLLLLRCRSLYRQPANSNTHNNGMLRLRAVGGRVPDWKHHLSKQQPKKQGDAPQHFTFSAAGLPPCRFYLPSLVLSRVSLCPRSLFAWTFPSFPVFFLIPFFLFLSLSLALFCHIFLYLPLSSLSQSHLSLTFARDQGVAQRPTSFTLTDTKLGVDKA